MRRYVFCAYATSIRISFVSTSLTRVLAATSRLKAYYNNKNKNAGGVTLKGRKGSISAAAASSLGCDGLEALGLINNNLRGLVEFGR